jgi:hypothetical protein
LQLLLYSGIAVLILQPHKCCSCWKPESPMGDTISLTHVPVSRKTEREIVRIYTWRHCSAGKRSRLCSQKHGCLHWAKENGQAKCSGLCL